MLIKDYKEWSNKVYNDNNFELINNETIEIKDIIIHHTYKPDHKSLLKNGFKQTLQSIQRNHIERGFSDIGYHYLIDMYGNIYKGRKDIHKGAHCIPNSVKIGIALIIDGNSEEITYYAYRSLKRLIYKLVVQENLKIDNHIWGHKDFNNTECPGKKIYPLIKDLKEQLKKEI